MDYNLAKIRNRVLKDKLDDDDYDPQVIDNFINDTQREVFNSVELPFMEKIFEGTIPQGVTMFKMPEDLALLQSVTMAGAPGFGRGRIEKWRDFFQVYPDIDNNEPEVPNQWTLYGGNMLLNAPTNEGYTMKMFYIKKPKTLVGDTDIPEIPYEFEELLVLGTFMRVQKLNEDYDLASQTEAEFNRQLMNLTDRYGYRMTGPIKMKNKQIG